MQVKDNIKTTVIGVDGTEQHPVDDFKIDDQVVIANEGGEKWIFPLTSIMGIEELKDENEDQD